LSEAVGKRPVRGSRLIRWSGHFTPHDFLLISPFFIIPSWWMYHLCLPW
jgi:hypothetical protein